MMQEATIGLERVKRIIGVVAGKGGVGKSTICLQLARGFQDRGWKVGILDADIHGPSMQRLAPPSASASIGEVGVRPADSSGLRVMSVAFLPKWADAAIVRAPIANALVEQFLHEVEWNDLDLLLIDFPPGTGDIPITLLQRADLDGVVAVTTPQKLAKQDVRKALIQTRESGVPVLGLIENMTGMQLATGQWMEMFGPAGSEELLAEFEPQLFYQLAFDPWMMSCSERGGHLFEAGLESSTRSCLTAAVSQLANILFPESRAIDSLIGEPEHESSPRFRVWIEHETELGLCAADGSSRRIDVEELRRACPCIVCREKHSQAMSSGGITGNSQAATPDPSAHVSRADRSLRIRGLREVGRYGVALQMEGGCSRGIFPYSLLERLGSVCVADG